MATNDVFISYDYDHDKADKDRLLGWNIDHEFEFCSYDKSINVPLDSNEAVAIKQAIGAQIGRASFFLCLVGHDTYCNSWAKWQIEKALDLKKNIIAVKPDSLSNSPAVLQRRDVSWCNFNLQSVKKAITMPTTGILPV